MIAFYYASAFYGDLSKWVIPQGTFVSSVFQNAQTKSFCPAGTFQNDKNYNLDCRKCPAGRYSPRHGQNSDLTCTACPVGKASNLTSIVTDCTWCAQGTFRDITGQSACAQCPSGFFRDAIGAINCLPCLPGQFASMPGRTKCTFCPIGWYQHSVNASRCTKASKGHYSNVAESGADFPCAAGTFQNQEGQSMCKVCPSGWYQDDQGSVVCSTCPAGFVQPAKRSGSCALCALGQFQEAAGQQACLSCPTGFYQDNQSSVVCSTCPAGFVQLPKDQDLAPSVLWASFKRLQVNKLVSPVPPASFLQKLHQWTALDVPQATPKTPPVQAHVTRAKGDRSSPSMVNEGAIIVGQAGWLPSSGRPAAMNVFPAILPAQRRSPSACPAPRARLLQRTVLRIALDALKERITRSKRAPSARLALQAMPQKAMGPSAASSALRASLPSVRAHARSVPWVVFLRRGHPRTAAHARVGASQS